jgi:hypothetical protein
MASTAEIKTKEREVDLWASRLRLSKPIHIESGEIVIFQQAVDKVQNYSRCHAELVSASYKNQ